MITRRSLVIAALPWPAVAQPAAAPLRVGALFAGRVDDGGFMQAGYEGLMRAQRELGVTSRIIQGVPPRPDALEAALRDLATPKPDLVVAHGGQNSPAARLVAAAFPDVRFAVTQGAVSAANLASYEVLQEQSAFLAGALAAMMTRTGVVGHMSGIRVVPGLKGRAAYAHGVRHVDPKVTLVTNFSGDQDAIALSHRIALAVIDRGADIIFTMLNAGRPGVTDACLARNVLQIGNVGDWTLRSPVFIASAIADSGLAMFNAIRDLAAGRFAAGSTRSIGLEEPDAVRLSLAPAVPDDVQLRIAALRDDIVAARLPVSTDWTGEEFTAG